MDDDLTYFLDLRLRLRGNAGAMALVDRCIRMIAMAATASPREIEDLQREAEELRDELKTRFGSKAPLRAH